MQFRFLVVAGLMVCCQSVFGSVAKIELKEQALRASLVRNVGGFIGSRIEANTNVRLTKFDIDRFVRMLEKKDYRQWFWIGEQPGKWLEAAVLSSEFGNDAQLRAKAEEILKRMVAAQEPNGYLGITSPAVRTPDQPVRGMDPYELYFTIHGLLTAYEDLHSKPALDSAEKLADFFVNNFGPGKVEFWPDIPAGAIGASVDSKVAGHSVHRGLEGTLLTDPIMRLYLITGDKKYLDWCESIVANIDKWSGYNTFSNLDKVAEGKMGIHEVQPYVHAHTFHMNFLAFLQLYRATGDASYLRKVVGAVKDISGRQRYITGAVSVGEHYTPDHDLPNSGAVCETCASMSWIELCQSLLELSSDPIYADAIERLMLNHLFAAQSADGESFLYHTPLNDAKPLPGMFRGPDCCTSSGSRILAKLPTLFYAQSKNDIYVNQFVPSTADFLLSGKKKVTLQQVTDFPASEKITINVLPSSSGAFALYVRLPKWCANPSLKVNGKPVSQLKPGTYAVISRKWAKNDTVQLTLPMQPKWVKGEYTNSGLWCLTRGPVVYALDSVWYTPEMRKAAGGAVSGDPSADLGGVKIDESNLSAGIEKADTPDGTMGQAYKVPITLPDGSESKALMLPFANVGKWYADENEHKNPEGVSHGYAVWVASSTGAAFSDILEQTKRRAALKPRIVDEVDLANDKAWNFQAGQEDAGIFHGRVWKTSSKWLSWDLKVLPDSPMVLNCTYWGGEVGQRNFNILVDGEKVGTIRLLNNKPGKFFDVEYPIPSSVTNGKSKVTVRFESVNGELVGGIFGCAVLKAQ